MDTLVNFESWLANQDALAFMVNMAQTSPSSMAQPSTPTETEVPSPLVLAESVLDPFDLTENLTEDKNVTDFLDSPQTMNTEAERSAESSGYSSGAQSFDFLSSPEGTPAHKGQRSRVVTQKPINQTDIQPSNDSSTPHSMTPDQQIQADAIEAGTDATEDTKPSAPKSGPKPEESYIEILARAILADPEQKMILADLYDYVETNYPYFRTGACAWRNSVRHNLSVNECFMKAGRARNGRGFFWAIHPACLHDFKKGDFNRRLARRRVQLANKEATRRQKQAATNQITPGYHGNPASTVNHVYPGYPANYPTSPAHLTNMVTSPGIQSRYPGNYNSYHGNQSNLHTSQLPCVGNLDSRSYHEARGIINTPSCEFMTSTPIRHSNEHHYSGYNNYSLALLARFHGSPLGNLAQLSVDNMQPQNLYYRPHAGYTTVPNTLTQSPHYSGSGYHL